MELDSILKDIVTYTHNLGFLNIVKINATSDIKTEINSITEDKSSVVLLGKTHQPIKEFQGVFGMTNLEKLNHHLKNPEYQTNSKIELVTQERNGDIVPAKIHFENETGDFQNDYRFTTAEIANTKVPDVEFGLNSWDIEFEPTITSKKRLKLMKDAHSEETVFKVRTEENNGKIDLIFSFGDHASHAGSFVFQSDVNNKLERPLVWRIDEVQSILNLNGNITMKISNHSAMMISVDSGIAIYDYILPALSK